MKYLLVLWALLASAMLADAAFSADAKSGGDKTKSDGDTRTGTGGGIDPRLFGQSCASINYEIQKTNAERANACHQIAGADISQTSWDDSNQTDCLDALSECASGYISTSFCTAIQKQDRANYLNQEVKDSEKDKNQLLRDLNKTEDDFNKDTETHQKDVNEKMNDIQKAQEDLQDKENKIMDDARQHYKDGVATLRKLQFQITNQRTAIDKMLKADRNAIIQKFTKALSAIAASCAQESRKTVEAKRAELRAKATGQNSPTGANTLTFANTTEAAAYYANGGQAGYERVTMLALYSNCMQRTENIAAKQDALQQKEVDLETLQANVNQASAQLASLIDEYNQTLADSKMDGAANQMKLLSAVSLSQQNVLRLQQEIQQSNTQFAQKQQMMASRIQQQEQIYGEKNQEYYNDKSALDSLKANGTIPNSTSSTSLASDLSDLRKSIYTGLTEEQQKNILNSDPNCRPGGAGGGTDKGGSGDAAHTQK